MAKREFTLTVEVEVKVLVDEDVATEDFGNAIDPKRSDDPNATRDDLVEGLAYGVVMLGKTDASRMDGWGDLPKGAAEMWTVDFGDVVYMDERVVS